MDVFTMYRDEKYSVKWRPPIVSKFRKALRFVNFSWWAWMFKNPVTSFNVAKTSSFEGSIAGSRGPNVKLSYICWNPSKLESKMVNDPSIIVQFWSLSMFPAWTMSENSQVFGQGPSQGTHSPFWFWIKRRACLMRYQKCITLIKKCLIR